MERNDIRAIIAQIRSYHAATQFIRNNGKVDLIVPSGKTEEQNFLLARYQQELMWYLTTPPDITGECWRCHTIQWICTSSGVWVCSCYYAPR